LNLSPRDAGGAQGRVRRRGHQPASAQAGKPVPPSILGSILIKIHPQSDFCRRHREKEGSKGKFFLTQLVLIIK
jgi:hypothetical protein